MSELQNEQADIDATTAYICPRCGDYLQAPTVLNALSRVDNSTYICNQCGFGEAMLNMRNTELPPVDQWLMPTDVGIADTQWCAYATIDEETMEWIVALVQEHEAGYFATPIKSEHQSYVERRADWLNKRHGINKDRAWVIVGSSFGAM